MSKTDSDKVEPFRQQAAAVGNMKRNALERLEKIESSLEELQLGLREKQDYSQTLQDTLAPKAEELKRYVSRLKTKGTVYKRCKAEVAGLKAENGVLHRTAVILDGQVYQAMFRLDRFERSCTLLSRSVMIVFQITHSYSTESASKVVIPETYVTENALATNTQLSQTIAALGTNLAPMIKGSVIRSFSL